MVTAYNAARNEFVNVEAGFLIVKTFARLYADYKGRYPLCRDMYAIPRTDRGPMQSPIQYRGLDRDALDDYAESEMDAEMHLAMLAIDNRAVNGIVFSQGDAEEVFSLLGSLQSDYEIIWTRAAGSNVAPPDGYSSAGSEPTYLASDHFSASCDCMLFPRWHGTDDEGELFVPHFRKLNSHGLFATPDAAHDFLAYYLSLDWTEHDANGDYVIAEIFIRQ